MSCEAEDEALTPCLSHYRQEWPVRPYEDSRIGGPDELRDVTQELEVALFRMAPIVSWIEGAPPVGTKAGGQKYLWVIRSSGMPYAQESGPLGLSIAGRGRLAHTNLTGGEDAHCGGELWFRGECDIWLTGGSGRYPPRCQEELEAVVAAICCAGYTVRSAGWSDEICGPARYFREDVVEDVV